MKTVELGRTGIQVSEVCLGNMLMGSTISKSESFQMLDYFVEQGGNFIDTANCYAWWVGKGEFVGDEGETVLGEWIRTRGKRDDLVISTKVGARLKNPGSVRNDKGEVYWDKIPDEYERLGADTIRQAVDNSLRRLQTDYIDVYLTHIEDRNTPQEEVLEALDRLVKAGKVRHIGCSNIKAWRVAQGRQISRDHGWPQYSVVQQQFSYLRPRFDADLGIAENVSEDLVDFLAANKDVALMGYSPLLKGIYDGIERCRAYYNWHIFDTADSLARLDTLWKLAADLGVNGNQLALAWLLHLDAPKNIPILGFSRMSQLELNLKALEIHLDADQMALMNAAGT